VQGSRGAGPTNPAFVNGRLMEETMAQYLRPRVISLPPCCLRNMLVRRSALQCTKMGNQTRDYKLSVMCT
jgi:hypothetical protein